MVKPNKNIILITIDCLRSDRCGFMGYEKNTTPFLDKLASESHIFEQAIAPGTWTSESFPGILAGLHSPDVAYHDKIRYKAIPPDTETLATQMSRSEYKTVATITNTQLTTERGFDTGFDKFSNLDVSKTESNSNSDEKIVSKVANYLEDVARDRIGTDDVMYELNKRDTLFTFYTLPAAGRQIKGHLTGWPYTRAGEVLEQFREDVLSDQSSKPVFGWTHLMDLHSPLHPDNIRAGGLCDSSRFKQIRDDINRIANNDAPIYDDMYDSSLRYIDDQISEFVSELKRQGEWENTTLIVTSDHGESLGDHGVYGHWTHYPYDDLLRVPLIARPAGGINTNRLNHVFSLSWLHELMTELVDAKKASMPSTSGIENHLSKEPKGTIAITDSIKSWGQLVVVRSDDWKLVRFYHGEDPENKSEKYEMIKDLGATDDNVMTTIDSYNCSFDLSADPTESSPRPLSEAPMTHQQIAEKIKTDPRSIIELSGTMSDELKNHLGDLGYL